MVSPTVSAAAAAGPPPYDPTRRLDAASVKRLRTILINDPAPPLSKRVERARIINFLDVLEHTTAALQDHAHHADDTGCYLAFQNNVIDMMKEHLSGLNPGRVAHERVLADLDLAGISIPRKPPAPRSQPTTPAGGGGGTRRRGGRGRGGGSGGGATASAGGASRRSPSARRRADGGTRR